MDYVKLFTDYHIPFTTKVNRGWVNVDCPYCISEHPMHLGFNPSDDYCTCWNCGGHNLRQTLLKLLRISTSELDDVMTSYQGRHSLLSRLNDKSDIIHPVKLDLPGDTLLPHERKYLRDRGYNPAYLHRKYGLVGGGVSGFWKYRIIIPMYIGGRLVSWTGRSIFPKDVLEKNEVPRYMNLAVSKSVLNPKSVLYNLDNCTRKSVVLTEGPFDVMNLGDDFCCSFGIELTQAQISVIHSRFQKVCIMFDNEPNAQQKARKFGLQLASIGLDVEVVNFYEDFDKNDGGELTLEEVNIIRNKLGLGDRDE